MSDQRALAIREKAVGAEHVETAAVLVDLAALERKRGREEAASPLLARALAAFEKSAPQAMRPRVRVTWARGLAIAGRVEDARRLVREIGAIGLRTPDFLDLCRDLGFQPPPRSGSN